MNEIVIIPIGSGSTGNCFYIELCNHKFLIDMGIGVKRVKETLEKHNRNLEDVEAIFLTHGHSDHIKAYRAIGNNTNCKVYGHSSVMYSIREINAGRVIIDDCFVLNDDLIVNSFSIPHDFVKTLGYCFECNGKRIAYLTDCGKLSKKLLSNFYGCPLVIIESNYDVDMLKNGPYPIELQNRIRSKYGHLSNDEAAEAVLELYEKGTRNFLLAHVSLHNNTFDLAYDTTKEKLKDKDIYLYVCKDVDDTLINI